MDCTQHHKKHAHPTPPTWHIVGASQLQSSDITLTPQKTNVRPHTQGTKTYSSRKTYGLTQLAIPFGIGIKLSLNKIICIGAEWSMRKTFTDYIDDVSTTYVDPVKLSTEKGLVAASLSNRSIDIPGSAPLITGMQRGDPKTKDWYSFAMITFTAKIYTKKNKGCHDYQKHSNYDEFLLN